MSEFYPRSKHCLKWILVADDKIPEEISDELNLMRFGTSGFVYTFDLKTNDLKNVYVKIATVFQEHNFDTAIMLFEPKNSVFVY